MKLYALYNQTKKDFYGIACIGHNTDGCVAETENRLVKKGSETTIWVTTNETIANAYATRADNTEAKYDHLGMPIVPWGDMERPCDVEIANDIRRGDVVKVVTFSETE